jgi:2',3'-cyclic-nucleotide 2'-phosphodiesterase
MPELRVLYVGDIMGRPGREVVAAVLPKLRQKHQVDLVIAQAENVSHGKSINPAHLRELQQMGVDFFTAGNHTMERPDLLPLVSDPDIPVLAPLNQVGVEPSWGAKTIKTKHGPVLVASLLGTTFPERDNFIHNPLAAIDELLKSRQNGEYIARIVNLHSDFSSEKRVIGYYLDGRVSAIIGDHWHVATADAMVLPGGTAHITDVGMCGTLHSSLGVTKEIIISRWRDGVSIKNEIAEGGPYQFNAVLIAINPVTRLASAIQPIHRMIASP